MIHDYLCSQCIVINSTSKMEIIYIFILGTILLYVFHIVPILYTTKPQRTINNKL